MQSDDGKPDVSPYIALIHPPEAGSSWGVTFPDVSGCVSGGSTFEEAVEAGREALSGHLAMLAAEGEALPTARSWSDLAADPSLVSEADGAVPHLIVPRRVPGERVRVNIMIDKGLLRLTDETAVAQGLTRSAFIEAALTVVADD